MATFTPRAQTSGETLISPAELIPPDHMIELVGSESPENFALIGKVVLGHLIDLCHLEPDGDILDIGCGAGRIAVPLTAYLSPQGSYEGFDVVPELVRWCTDNITTRHPRFRFSLVDLFNGQYREASTAQPRDFRFPFRDKQFDVVIANSVFTHMLPLDLERYISEAARVLRPGGKLLASFFLINDKSLRLISAGRSALTFENDCGIHRVNWEHDPEGAVAFPEEYVLELARAQGYDVKSPVYYGGWPGRSESLDYQDIVIGVRRGPT